MGWKPASSSKADPSGIKQQFSNIGVKIHCCRYWKLSEWEFNNMSFPFWRIYFNTLEGARTYFGHQEVALNDRVVVLIPPYTSFSTSLRKWDRESFSGSRIQSLEECAHLGASGMIDHLFIHFNLGFQHDQVEPGIYTFEITPGLRELLDEIRQNTILSDGRFGFNETMLLHRLIYRLVSMVPDQKRVNNMVDQRILKVIEYIDHNYRESLNNDLLAQLAAMATNSYLRLFRHSTGVTLQQFVQNKRIEKAITLMHNQSGSIDQIAEWCGFSDRHHFSKVFKKLVGVAPGTYRKTHTIN
jgi:AraC-like DNA-binding protein